MAPRSRSSTTLDRELAKTLDVTFTAQLAEDLRALDLLRGQKGVAASSKIPTDVPALARRVAALLNKSESGTQSRLYGYGIPIQHKQRSALMQAVQTVLTEAFGAVGGELQTNYMWYLAPLDSPFDEEEGASDPSLQLEMLINMRIGSYLALQYNAAHLDTRHHYTLLHRLDLLDYPTGDFYSIRRLAGWNASKTVSDCVLYRESSERMFTFEDAAVRAFNNEDRNAPDDHCQLFVDPEVEQGVKAHTQPFRIYFPHPLEPREEFDLVFSIRCPGELHDLGHKEEFMSVALVRITQGLERLEFDVATNYRPATMGASHLTRTDRFVVCSGQAPRLEEYHPTAWYEDPSVLGINWSVDHPYVIRWGTSMPRGKMYVIKFRKS